MVYAEPEGDWYLLPHHIYTPHMECDHFYVLVHYYLIKERVRVCQSSSGVPEVVGFDQDRIGRFHFYHGLVIGQEPNKAGDGGRGPQQHSHEGKSTDHQEKLDNAFQGY